ncbi:glyoxalase [Mucilaginibacter hurinus]|uniref:Glyoxalase n=1 Tax=Mucilaginibacter hurinus TaxID=2201324 RepID=A0A367GNX7_9SPHI|nr:glyoxalase [Mucilaginibacter hurinus]RCH54758.1 glyoxalase [Mucilaginibacter hurinus]
MSAGNTSNSGIFITFSGNCKSALTFYQKCFGGILRFETFEKDLHGYTEKPVISGSLLSDHIVIYGSDLVHDEGRKIGNYLSVFFRCDNETDRATLVKKICHGSNCRPAPIDDNQKLIEVTDAFDVTWVLGV